MSKGRAFHSVGAASAKALRQQSTWHVQGLHREDSVARVETMLRDRIVGDGFRDSSGPVHRSCRVLQITVRMLKGLSRRATF